MKNGFILTAFFMAAIFLYSPLKAQKVTKIQQDADKKGVTLPPSPWHLMDIWWYFQYSTKDFQRLDIDIHIDKNVPDDVNLYIAPLGLAQLSGINCYGGLQTHTGGWTSKDSRKIVRGGRGGIFHAGAKTTNRSDSTMWICSPADFVKAMAMKGNFAASGAHTPGMPGRTPSR